GVSVVSSVVAPAFAQCPPREIDKVTAADGPPEMNFFGYAVDLSGDTLVVGSWMDDNERGVKAGRVYVYTRGGDAWVPSAKLVGADTTAGDGFGVSVALSADTLVIGALEHAGQDAPGAGAAYVFTRANGEWTQQAKLTAPNGAAHDHFGSAAALDAD